ncbi:9349_t:CDS:2 [Paraglomus brasilianum]|uniref:9349_t:CDS:1 n=1 Tax=Paraglomus brasilianum TaxID=144538 RepID=A0A9N9CVC2_9GLOM|nr:9349_t:CDS:2 [Paraglomus brasilianum]
MSVHTGAKKTSPLEMKLSGEIPCQVFSSLPSKPDLLKEIDILIECYLTEEYRQSVDMNLPCSNQKPMFDYPVYLETLNYFKLFYLVTRWIKSQPEIDDVKMRTGRRRLVHAILRVYARSHVQKRIELIFTAWMEDRGTDDEQRPFAVMLEQNELDELIVQPPPGLNRFFAVINAGIMPQSKTLRLMEFRSINFATYEKPFGALQKCTSIEISNNKGLPALDEWAMKNAGVILALTEKPKSKISEPVTHASYPSQTTT